MTTSHPCEVHHLDWRGIRIEVRYCADWSKAYRDVFGTAMAHIEITSVEPARSPLPLTETGCLSHFEPAANIEAAGGPADYIREALDKAAEGDVWIEQEARNRQMTLF